MIDEKEIARLRVQATYDDVPTLLDEVITLRDRLAEARAQIAIDEERASNRGWPNIASPTALYEHALTETEEERNGLRARVAEYESGCHHAWKALPTRYDVVIDEHMAAGETRDDVNRRASWVETAIRDMGGDLERAESKLHAVRTAAAPIILGGGVVTPKEREALRDAIGDS